MRELLGSLCIFAAGGVVWSRRRQGRRRQRELLWELAAALDQMEAEIRLERTPLPLLFRHMVQESGQETEGLFAAVARAVTAGEAPSVSWRRAVSALPLSEGDERVLIRVADAMQDSETNICKVMSLASDSLRKSLSVLEARRSEEDKRATALCFSTAALLVILLI